MRKIISAALLLMIILFACDDLDLYYYAKYGPKPDKVYLFMHDGMVTGDMGGSDGADDLCREQYKNQYSNKNFFSINAFLSVSSKDKIRDLLPDKYWDTPVYGIHDTSYAETLISSSWSGLWDGSIEVDFYSSLNISADWWSGSDSNGNFYSSCNGWTSADSGVYGTAGAYGAVAATWIDNGTSVDCSNSQNLICIGY